MKKEKTEGVELLKDKVNEVILQKQEEGILDKEPKPNRVKRDISIDLIRVVACLLVIATHMCLQVLNQAFNRIDWGRLLEKSFLTDGVPLFFLITGFFLVNGRSYKKIWKGALTKVLIPALIFIILTQAFYPFIVNKASFMECLNPINIEPLKIIEAILKGDVTKLNATCAHLWYIFSYIKILLWIPLLWLVCKDNKESNLARRMLMIFAAVKAVLYDVQRFGITIPVIGELPLFTMIPTEILYVLLGYELFRNKDKIKNNKKVCVLSLVTFGLINLLRYKLEMQFMVNNFLTDVTGRANFLEWRYTALNLISGVSLFMFLYSFEIKSVKLTRLIIWLSKMTFGVYLIHYVILAKIDLYKFEVIEKFVFELMYLAFGTIIIFALSIACVWIITKLYQLICKAFKRIIKLN